VKVTFETEPFKQAWAPIAKVPSSKTPSPVLASVLLRPRLGHAVIDARNVELAASRAIPGDCDVAEGGVLLPAEGFDRIVRTAKGDSLTIESADGAATIRSGSARFTLRTEDPSRFPAMADLPTAEPDAAIKLEDFQLLVRRAVGFANPDAGWAYAGCSVELMDGAIALVAADTYRAARQQVPADCRDTQGDRRWLVPAKSFALAATMMGGDKVLLRLPNSRVATLESAGTMVEVRLCEGRLPAIFWRPHEAFPGGTRIPLDVAAFKAAVAQAAITTGEESSGIRLRFAPGALGLSSRRADFGDAAVEVPWDYAGPEVTVAVMGRLLDGAFRTVNQDEPLEVDFCADPLKPVMFRSDDFFLGVQPLSQEASP
jgi:DNA polymerase III subunit beta